MFSNLHSTKVLDLQKFKVAFRFCLVTDMNNDR